MKTTDARVRRFERLDFKVSELAKPEVTADGFLKLEGKVARTGVQLYHDALGGTRRELRRTEDVKASLPGFTLAPLTNGHPPQLVDPSTAKQYAAGAVGPAEYADGWVKAPITVWTKDAIEAVRAGRAQLSVGYTCRLTREEGEHEGEKYDSVQSDIVVNHVALVDAARAGPEARLRLDAADAMTGFGLSESGVVVSTSTTAPQGETPRMHIIKVDGLDVKVESTNDGSIIEKAMDGIRAKAAAELAAERKRADDAVASLATVTAEKTTLQANHDALSASSKKDVKCDECDGSGKIGEASCEGCAGKGEMKADALTFEWRKASRARSDARAASARGASRAALIARVSPLLSKNEKLDSKTDVEIKKLAIVALDKDFKADGKVDAYVEAYFDAQMKIHEAKALRPIDRVKLVQDGAGTTPAPTGTAEAEQHADGKNEGEVSARSKQRAHYDSQYYKNQPRAEK
jgi:hypothetical protein